MGTAANFWTDLDKVQRDVAGRKAQWQRHLSCDQCLEHLHKWKGKAHSIKLFSGVFPCNTGCQCCHTNIHIGVPKYLFNFLRNIWHNNKASKTHMCVYMCVYIGVHTWHACGDHRTPSACGNVTEMQSPVYLLTKWELTMTTLIQGPRHKRF